MDWSERCRARLPEYLDRHGDLAPPWERFPEYERYSLGWRMGTGEDWMGLWSAFLEQLGPDRAARVAYLRRHAPAPISWANTVHDVLNPGASDDDDDDDDNDDDDGNDDENDALSAERRAALLEQGLIAPDVAFETWLRQQTGVRWPWERNDSPEGAARYDTREFWFWSRRIAELRGSANWSPPPMPEAWSACAEALASGVANNVDPSRGLLTLARFLAAGEVRAPWRLGLTPVDFRDSFEMDMGYIDAFRLWGMSAIDDREQIEAHLRAAPPPEAWAAWVREHLRVD
jgi:hypothetical protein